MTRTTHQIALFRNSAAICLIMNIFTKFAPRIELILFLLIGAIKGLHFLMKQPFVSWSNIQRLELQ